MTSNQQQILFIGDSLTEWFDLKKYFPGVPIINEGIAGDTTYGLIERLDSIIKSAPSKTFLMIGINDVFNEFSREDIIENQQLILETIQTHSATSEIIVQSLLPVNETMLGVSNGLNKMIRQINKELKSHCDARGVEFLNLYTAFLSGDQMKSEYTTDGGHLSEAGYELWAIKLQPYLH